MTKTRRSVGIMIANHRYRKSVLQAYRKVTPKNIKIFTFTPASINWVTKKINGLHYLNKKFQTKWVPFPDVVYNRCYGAKRPLLERIEKIVGKNKCFNHLNHLDKKFTYDVLCNTEVGQYLPATLPYNDENLDGLLGSCETLYLKPVLGNSGKGVYRVSKTETSQVCISQHYFTSPLIFRDPLAVKAEIDKLTQSKTYVVQQGIPFIQVDNKNFDIRVLVQKNQTGSWSVTNIVSRTAYPGCFNTSVCESVTPSEQILKSLFNSDEVQNLLTSLAEVSLKAAALLEQNGGCHLGELSVDFGVDTEKALWIIEINGNPQRAMYKGFKSYQDVYKNPIRYAQFLMSKSRQESVTTVSSRSEE